MYIYWLGVSVCSQWCLGRISQLLILFSKSKCCSKTMNHERWVLIYSIPRPIFWYSQAVRQLVNKPTIYTRISAKHIVTLMWISAKCTSNAYNVTTLFRKISAQPVERSSNSASSCLLKQAWQKLQVVAVASKCSLAKVILKWITPVHGTASLDLEHVCWQVCQPHLTNLHTDI